MFEFHAKTPPVRKSRINVGLGVVVCKWIIIYESVVQRKKEFGKIVDNANV